MTDARLDSPEAAAVTPEIDLKASATPAIPAAIPASLSGGVSSIHLANLLSQGSAFWMAATSLSPSHSARGLSAMRILLTAGPKVVNAAPRTLPRFSASVPAREATAPANSPI